MSLLPLNVGRTDRFIRIFAGVVLEIAALFVKNHPYGASAMAAVGALLILEGAAGY
jgi:hypothetical protein